MRRYRWNVWSRRLAAALASSAVLALGLAACEEEAQGFGTQARGADLDRAGWGPASADGVATAEAAGRKTDSFAGARAESDAEIAHAVLTIGQAELAHARLARVRSSDPRVREHAEQAIEEQQRALRAYGQTLWQLGLSPAPGPLGTALERRALERFAELARLVGPEFDAAYVASRLEARNAALSLFESQLLPNATAGAHRRSLDDYVVPTVSSQLRRAAEIESDLGLLPPRDLTDPALDETTPEETAPDAPPLDEAPPDEALLEDREFGAPPRGTPEFADPEFADPEFADPEFPDPEFADPEFADPGR